MLATLSTFFASPEGQQLAAIASFIIAAAVTELLRRSAAARRAAEVFADLAATVGPLVDAAELAGGPGVAKYARVLHQVQAWLDGQGIRGEPRRLLERDLPDLIEEAVRRLPLAGPSVSGSAT